MPDIQEQRLDYLLRALRTENEDAYLALTAAGFRNKHQLLRALSNIRPPLPISDEFLHIQDLYLSQLSSDKGAVALSDIMPYPALPKLSLWQGDITRLSADAIVNAANSQMLGCFVPLHTCIDNCIHSFAGIQMRAECHRQMELLRQQHGTDYEQPTAVPLLTAGYNLPARHVIHIVGPIVSDLLKSEHERDLASCYQRSLDLCSKQGLRSIAFCCISTGIFRFPPDRAAAIAVKSVREWLSDHADRIDRVIFNVFSDRDWQTYRQQLEHSS
ncbi:protein-ADP-ribose hydrolase [bacterium]|nr:protein-ADP-ribose hydrolase [bacterium]